MSENNVWFTSFLIIIISTVGFMIATFAAADESIRLFSRDISIILIPIIAGVIVTKFTTDSWQITKEKIAIKQSILEDYANSYKKMSTLQDNFIFFVIEKYVTFSNNVSGPSLTQYSRPNHEIYARLPNQINSNDLPKEKCKIAYTVLQQKLYSAAILQNQLFSKIRLHYDDDTLLDQVNILKSLIDEQGIILQRLMESENVNELKKFFDIYMSTIKGVKSKFKEVEMIMINNKFREIKL